MKKILNNCLLALAVTGGFVLQTFAQNDLRAKFDEYQQNALQEKIFVHTDKDHYVTGESIWFKVYSVDGTFHKRLDLSKVAYVQIIDSQNTPVVQTKIRLREGKGNGSISLPSLNSGAYTLRAYTRWMKNFSESYFFEKQLNVVNQHQGIQKLAQATDRETIHVTFFPEGGNLVNGLTSKVAFKIVNNTGKSVDAVGVIVDENGNVIANFRSLKFGIGNFIFTPSGDHRYEAILTFQGNESHHPLPEIFKQGYAMQVKELGAEKLHVIVSKHAENNASETISLFVHARQLIKIAVSTAMKDGQAGFLVDKNKLSEGISHFTVFNGSDQPVCERLYFTRPMNKLQPELKTNKRVYSPRQKVEAAIFTTDNNTNPITASLSLSVYRMDSLQGINHDNILSYCLLTSDLNGYVESPDYYLSERDSLASQAADNLMLTHGWRRFNWTDVLKKTTPEIVFTPEYEGVTISGKITNAKSQQPLANASTYLSIPGANPQFYATHSNSKGEFEFYVNDPAGTDEIVIQPSDDVGQYSITIDNPYCLKYSDRKFPVTNLAAGLNSMLLRSTIHTQVENYFKKDKVSFKHPQRDSLSFYHSPDKRYILNDYEKFSTLEEVLREYVPEVMVWRREGKLNLFVLNKREQAFFTKKPLILLDGIPVTDDQKIVSLNAQHVKTLDVITQRYSFGRMMFSGIINFRTYNGDLANIQLDPNTVVLDFEGLQLQREFYSPQYETIDQKKSRVPDFRNVLLWSPDIITDKAGKSQVSFYTSDAKGTFVGVIQGISDDGLMGSSTFTFTVSDQ